MHIWNLPIDIILLLTEFMSNIELFVLKKTYKYVKHVVNRPNLIYLSDFFNSPAKLILWSFSNVRGIYENDYNTFIVKLVRGRRLTILKAILFIRFIKFDDGRKIVLQDLKTKFKENNEFVEYLIFCSRDDDGMRKWLCKQLK